MKLYCGTYHKYSCGSIFGEWMDLDDFENPDEFIKACNSLHKDEFYPEFMFQDYEADYGWEEALYSEHTVPYEYWNVKKALQDSKIDEKAFSAFVEVFSEPIDAKLINLFSWSYQGKYDSAEDYAQSFCEETGLTETIPKSFIYYINYEAMARDWILSGDITFNNGYVFLRY